MPEADLINWLTTYGYLIIFPLTLVEGNVVAVTAGFLASLNYFNPFIIGIIFIIADFASDVLLYYLGKTSNGALMWSKRVRGVIASLESGSKENNLAVQSFDKNFERLFALVKILPIPQLPTITLIAAGFLEIDLKRLVKTFIIIEPIKAVIYVGAGYYVGTGVFDSSFFGSTLGTLLAILLGLLIISIFWGRSYVKRSFPLSGLEKSPLTNNSESGEVH